MHWRQHAENMHLPLSVSSSVTCDFLRKPAAADFYSTGVHKTTEMRSKGKKEQGNKGQR